MTSLIEENMDQLIDQARNNAVRWIPRKLLELNGTTELIDMEAE